VTRGDRALANLAKHPYRAERPNEHPHGNR
jgi:hypothetical protein